MWIYIGIGGVVAVIVCIAIYIAYSMVQHFLRFLESKREVRIHRTDVGLNVKMHRPDHLKKLMKDFKVDEFKRDYSRMLRAGDAVGSGYGPTCATWGFPIEAIKAESDGELQNIYSSLECPICHQFPKTGTVFSCKQNRHMICEACLPPSRICPACQDPIISEKSFTAESCISNFIIPCKFKFQGCHEIIRGENVREHLKSCNYRPIPCVMAKCTEIVPFKQLFNHLLTIHGSKVNGVKDSQKHIVEWWIEGDVNATARWPPFYLTAFDNVFLYMCVSTIHGTWSWLWILANIDEAQRFKVETKIENVENGIAIQWKGPVHPIRKSVREIIASGQVFVTNSKEIHNPFLFKKGNDKKSFWRTEVVIHQVSFPLPTSIPYLETNDPYKKFISIAKDSSWAYNVGPLSGQDKTMPILPLPFQNVSPEETAQNTTEAGNPSFIETDDFKEMVDVEKELIIQTYDEINHPEEIPETQSVQASQPNIDAPPPAEEIQIGSDLPLDHPETEEIDEAKTLSNNPNVDTKEILLPDEAETIDTSIKPVDISVLETIDTEASIKPVDISVLETTPLNIVNNVSEELITMEPIPSTTVVPNPSSHDEPEEVLANDDSTIIPEVITVTSDSKVLDPILSESLQPQEE